MTTIQCILQTGLDAGIHIWSVGANVSLVFVTLQYADEFQEGIQQALQTNTLTLTIVFQHLFVKINLFNGGVKCLCLQYGLELQSDLVITAVTKQHRCVPTESTSHQFDGPFTGINENVADYSRIFNKETTKFPCEILVE